MSIHLLICTHYLNLSDYRILKIDSMGMWYHPQWPLAERFCKLIIAFRDTENTRRVLSIDKKTSQRKKNAKEG